MQRFITKTASRIIFLIILVGYTNTFAWIYPEHRDITLLAVQNLSEQNRSTLDKLWVEARLGFENRLTAPVPGLATGLGELPRFRSELGTFIGVVSAVRGNAVSGGFGTTQNTPGVTGGIDAGVRIGLGLEGVMNSGGDGLVSSISSSLKSRPTQNMKSPIMRKIMNG